MSLPVFLHEFDQLPHPEQVLRVTGAEAKHIAVRRLRVGEEVLLANGADGLVHGVLMHVEGRECHIRVISAEQMTRPTPHVTVVQALPKSDRAELAVDLMVESGVDAIVPWAAKNCVAKWNGKEEKARQKWQNASREAAKQARRAWIPPVASLHREADVVKLIEETVGANGVVAVLHEEEHASFAEFAKNAVDAKRVVFIVGPEGGVSPEELEVFRAAGAQSILLGPTVLRTALAGAAALNALGPLTNRWS